MVAEECPVKAIIDVCDEPHNQRYPSSMVSCGVKREVEKKELCIKEIALRQVFAVHLARVPRIDILPEQWLHTAGGSTISFAIRKFSVDSNDEKSSTALRSDGRSYIIAHPPPAIWGNLY